MDGLYTNLIDDNGNLPAPSVFRRRFNALSDDELYQIMLNMDRLKCKSDLRAAHQRLESLRSENHELRQSLQVTIMSQAEAAETTPVDGDTDHINFKKNNHITGKFKRELMETAAKDHTAA